MSLDMTGGRVHFTEYNRRRGAFHRIGQEAGCMPLDMTGDRVHFPDMKRGRVHVT
jgi:hypothetical protein